MRLGCVWIVWLGWDRECPLVTYISTHLEVTPLLILLSTICSMYLINEARQSRRQTRCGGEGGYGIRRSPYGGAGLKLCYTAVVLRDYFVWAE